MYSFYREVLNQAYVGLCIVHSIRLIFIHIAFSKDA